MTTSPVPHTPPRRKNLFSGTVRRIWAPNDISVSGKINRLREMRITATEADQLLDTNFDLFRIGSVHFSDKIKNRKHKIRRTTLPAAEPGCRILERR
jgi:hypothetical protein